jgi:hypothetical protein
MTPEQVAVAKRSGWPLWGAAAGALGIITNIGLSSSIDYTQTPDDIVAGLSRGRYQTGAVTGYLAVACLLVFAAGLRRWADRRSSTSLALAAAPMALVASAGAMIAGYGVKGQLAEYLPGGTNPDNFGPGALYTFFLIDDLAGYFAWWGVAVAAGCLAWIALHERLLPRWFGIVATLFALAPLAYLVGTGFTGFSGLVMPLFLVVTGAVLAMQRE